jgi:hypothetical protein
MNKINENKIIFKATSKFGFDNHIRPYPASKVIPSWWKNSTPFDISENNPDGNKLKIINRVSNANFKKCVPMLDAITAGYIVDLWKDVEIRQENNMPVILWQHQNDFYENIYKTSVIADVFQKQPNPGVETPTGYSDHTFKYVSTWAPKTPKGYSCLVISPFGYKQSPILALPAIIDTDKRSVDLVVPMCIKNGFEGIVKRGTPLLQVIPFKRSDWFAEYDYYENNDFRDEVEATFFTTIVGHYIKNIWSKKTYR